LPIVLLLLRLPDGVREGTRIADESISVSAKCCGIGCWCMTICRTAAVARPLDLLDDADVVDEHRSTGLKSILAGSPSFIKLTAAPDR
jgi:hypothetical protein